MEMKISITLVLHAVSLGKRKDQGTCIVAIGTDDGKVLAVDVSTGDKRWPTSHPIPGGICGLSFAKKGQLLCVVGHDGKAYEINSETGELLKEFRVSKKIHLFTGFFT
ncbi:hypothetical protein RYX36_013355 [Vicia faba]